MYALLNRIEKPEDVKALTVRELEQLASELRHFIIDTVSQNGGHLAPNLGTVELTLALYSVFSFPGDKLVWDVGHQAYTHKILTGRRDAFKTLRKKGGITGFPNRSESVYDAFGVGHASTSISAALGMALARDARGEKNQVIAVIGDGALTGGESFEALNNAGDLGTKLIVILNDNEMSIDANVGAMSEYLSRIRIAPQYARAKRDMGSLLMSIPHIGDKVYKTASHLKDGVRSVLVPGSLFEEMGFQYIGPVNGHDVDMLTHTLTNLREQYAPIFLHIVTQKGKGLKPAEENPGEFHAVSSIDLNHLTNPELSPKDSFSSTFGCALADLGDDEPRLCGITAAMKYGTGLNFFKHRHPGRFFDVGMAEEHAVSFAAGLASQGLLPVVAIYSTFFQRAYDQIIHDVNLMQLDVLFAVDRAGLVPGDGATHQGIYDVAFFSNVNIPVFAPANYAELRYWLTYLVREARGPRTIRYARGEENPALAALPCTGKRFDLLEPAAGARIALVSYGAETEEIIAARDLLAQNGQQADCVKLTQIYPLPDGLCDALTPYDTILFAEDSVRTGSIGEQLGFALQQCGWQGRYLLHAVDNTHLLHANVPELRKDQQLDAAALCTDILNHLKEKQA